MEKVWMIDLQDPSLPKEVQDEINKVQRHYDIPNESLEIVSIKDLQGEYNLYSECCETPSLLGFLKSQGLSEDEKVYIRIWW